MLLSPLLLAAMNSSAPEYSLTIYSSAEPQSLSTASSFGKSARRVPGFALVRDERSLQLTRGRQELRFSDVAGRLDPTTVAFTSLTDPAGTRVLEQNYQYDLVSGQKLLERYLGQTITVIQVLGEQVQRLTGELLSAQNGITLRLPNGEVSTLSRWHAIDYPALPGGLITKPTLVWLLDAARAGEHRVRVTYQALGLTWWADYNLILDERDGCRLDLSAWVTIVNQSGGSFPNASLKLVAGDVNRVRPTAVKMRAMSEEMTVAGAMDGFQQSELFEYHVYTLGRRTDLPDNSTKQIELFPAVNGATCRKQLVFTAAPVAPVFYGPNTDQGFAASQRGQTQVFLEFDNRAENRMGMPLPAGRVRVNQLAADGSLEFIGEDLLRHTPRNETVSLRLGTAFDITGERRQTDFRSDSKGRWMEESFAIEVRNRKKVKATIIVREYLYRWSSWKILESSHRYEKRDAQTIDFPIEVPADGAVSVRYRVRYEW